MGSLLDDDVTSVDVLDGGTVGHGDDPEPGDPAGEDPVRHCTRHTTPTDAPRTASPSAAAAAATSVVRSGREKSEDDGGGRGGGGPA